MPLIQHARMDKNISHESFPKSVHYLNHATCNGKQELVRTKLVQLVEDFVQ